MPEICRSSPGDRFKAFMAPSGPRRPPEARFKAFLDPARKMSPGSFPEGHFKAFLAPARKVSPEGFQKIIMRRDLFANPTVNSVIQIE